MTNDNNYSLVVRFDKVQADKMILLCIQSPRIT